MTRLPRRGRVLAVVRHGAHVVASIGTPDDGARFTLCGMPVFLDDRAALDTDPDCQGCYFRPAARPRRRTR